jgi:orotate phosphoribosyltransferase
MDTQQQLVTLLAQRSAKRGHFVLASGRTSNLYIDARLTTMSPEGLVLIGALGLATVQRVFGVTTVDAIGGLTLGADPIAYAISYASATTARPLRAFTVRKEAKAHGAGRQVEGPYREGDRVVVVEDVITTGGSALKAVEVLRAHGAEIVGVLALVDREEGGREAIEAAGLTVVSLARAAEILPLLPSI